MHRAKSEINYIRGVPPVVNDPVVTELLRDAMIARRGVESDRGHRAEPRRRGLLLVPGARARRHGPARRPHARATRTVRDLHQGDFDADEHAITVGVELFTAAALLDARPYRYRRSRRPVAARPRARRLCACPYAQCGAHLTLRHPVHGTSTDLRAPCPVRPVRSVVHRT